MAQSLKNVIQVKAVFYNQHMNICLPQAKISI